MRKADFDLVIKDTNIESECLYSGTLDAINITLWAVKWELILGDHAITGFGSLEGLENFDEVRGTSVIGPSEQIHTED
jgi:hypothetical protein